MAPDKMPKEALPGTLAATGPVERPRTDEKMICGNISELWAYP